MPLVPLPPYALAATSFPFRHLAGLAGKAPIGGAREVALACFVAARLASEHVRALDEDVDTRTTRCSGAKAWLATLALPAPVKASVARCADATVSGSREAISRELSTLAAAASTYLDGPSRNELEALATLLKGLSS